MTNVSTATDATISKHATTSNATISTEQNQMQAMEFCTKKSENVLKRVLKAKSSRKQKRQKSKIWLEV